MAGGTLRSVCRRKPLDPDQFEGGKLKRCLNYWDVTSLGVGSTLGAGVYVMVGAVAFKFAGPSVLLSYLIAAVTALCTGLCYAEMGARVPLAGSVYAYTHATVGQLAAFIVGWCSVLEFVFGAASIARGLTLYIDSTVDKSVSTWFLETMPLAAAYMSPYFDLLSFLFSLALAVSLLGGVRYATTLNNVLSAGNMVIILFVVILGAFKANSINWSMALAEVPAEHGSGGFFPHGVWGTLKGAAVCFYGFMGFNVISYSAEEVKDPRRALPTAILSALFAVFAAYASASIVLTMMVPYYQLEGITSAATAFTLVGWQWARWVIAVGAILGICTSSLGCLYCLPRLLYSMASDGLFFPCFANVNERTQSPTLGTVVPSIIIAIMAGILELETLIQLMCFGTLFSFTVVGFCLVLLRYRPNTSELSMGSLKQSFSCGVRVPSKTSYIFTVVALVIYISLCISLGVVHIYTAKPFIPSVTLHALAVAVVVFMALQPKAKEELDFKAPLVPFIPCLSIYANVNLIVAINIGTWARVAIWFAIGIPIYIICVCCFNENKPTVYNTNENKSAKPPVQIVVESPTPPSTIAHSSNDGDYVDKEEIQEVHETSIRPHTNEEFAVQKVIVEQNEEKEAKIIDLLDQVLQAEEDSYGEIDIHKENKETEDDPEPIMQRKSLSELSDAGSDASLGNQGLSKYDVIAQVHREDLPKVKEEEEKNDNTDNIPNDDYEEITAFNDSETNSRTDESGYSDTIDKTPLHGSIEDSKEAFYIPEPPPMDEDYFKSTNYKKFNTVPSQHYRSEIDVDDDDEISQPRESVTSNKSNSSYGDGNMRFGSDRQIKFMSKLNVIFQNKIDNNEDEPRKRSHSTGTIPDMELSETYERPSLFLDMKKELLSRDAIKNLRPINTDEKTQVTVPPESSESEDAEDLSMSREDLKNKLEAIFATGGPRLLKPRLVKSNSNAPEESFQSDNSSTESIPKLKKNDTLKRQKAKFGEVLNHIRLNNMNKDDHV